MSIKFTKMHGLGNDFMVIDGVNQSIELSKEQIAQWSDRNFGIGFDQLLLVENTDLIGAEFKYRIFNADGGEVEQCGNGARCFARFVREKGLTDHTIIPVETATGIITLEMISDSNVRVDMGAPRFAPKDIPLNAAIQESYDIDFHGQSIIFSAISMGNPHAVIVLEDINSAPVKDVGLYLQGHAIFPQSVNVGFMQILNKETIKLRVYERGVGETAACGTGACAAVVAGQQLNLLNNNVRVNVPAGHLDIEWMGSDNPVMMTGTTASVFEGEIN